MSSRWVSRPLLGGFEVWDVTDGRIVARFEGADAERNALLFIAARILIAAVQLSDAGGK